MKAIKIVFGVILYYLFRLLPIKNNSVFFMSLDNSISDNPKYIYLELLKQRPTCDFNYMVEPNKILNMDINQDHVVAKYSIKSFYKLATSKVVISNYRKLHLLRLRKNQYYIQTWHGTPLKKIEQDVEAQLTKSYIKNAVTDSSDCDVIMSGNTFTTKIIHKGFWYDGKVVEYGTPRNDIMFEQDSVKKQQIKDRLQIIESEKIILYAPTFRGVNSTILPEFDVDSLLQAVNKESQEYVLILRLHPNVSKGVDLTKHFQSDYGRIIDGGIHPDMMELLLISDILITDYSSTMFDFSLTYKPCILYTYDEEEYVNNDRGTYLALDELPYPRYQTMDQMIEGIQSFDTKQYKLDVTEFFNTLGNKENGNASKSIVQDIIKVMTQ